MSIEILASKFPDVMGTYRRLSHITRSSQLHLVSAFLSKMFDVCDLPVLAFSNCVLKAVIKWPVKLYVRFLRFFTFFSKSKKQLFTYF